MFVLEKRCEPALRILYYNLSDFSKLIACDPVFGLFDHGVTGVVVCKAEEQPSAINKIYQLLCLTKIETHRFVTHNIKTAL